MTQTYYERLQADAEQQLCHEASAHDQATDVRRQAGSALASAKQFAHAVAKVIMREVCIDL